MLIGVILITAGTLYFAKKLMAYEQYADYLCEEAQADLAVEREAKRRNDSRGGSSEVFDDGV